MSPAYADVYVVPTFRSASACPRRTRTFEMVAVSTKALIMVTPSAAKTIGQRSHEIADAGDVGVARNEGKGLRVDGPGAMRE